MRTRRGRCDGCGVGCGVSGTAGVLGRAVGLQRAWVGDASAGLGRGGPGVCGEGVGGDLGLLDVAHGWVGGGQRVSEYAGLAGAGRRGAGRRGRGWRGWGLKYSRRLHLGALLRLMSSRHQFTSVIAINCSRPLFCPRDASQPALRPRPPRPRPRPIQVRPLSRTHTQATPPCPLTAAPENQTVPRARPRRLLHLSRRITLIAPIDLPCMDAEPRPPSLDRQRATVLAG